MARIIRGMGSLSLAIGTIFSIYGGFLQYPDPRVPRKSIQESLGEVTKAFHQVIGKNVK